MISSVIWLRSRKLELGLAFLAIIVSPEAEARGLWRRALVERPDPPFGDAIMAFPRRIWVELAIHVDSPPGNRLSEGRQGFRSLKTVRSLKLSVTPLARDTQNVPASMEPSLRLWELLGLGEVIKGV